MPFFQNMYEHFCWFTPVATCTCLPPWPPPPMLRMKIVSAKELFATPGAARCRDGTVEKVMTMVIMMVEKMIAMIIIIIVTMIIMVFKIIMVVVKMMIIQARDGFCHYLDNLFLTVNRQHELRGNCWGMSFTIIRKIPDPECQGCLVRRWNVDIVVIISRIYISDSLVVSVWKKKVFKSLLPVSVSPVSLVSPLLAQFLTPLKKIWTLF